MLRLAARAKINWSLDILGTVVDEYKHPGLPASPYQGYHLMDMLMESVALADDLTLQKQDQGLTLQVSGVPVPAGEDNLVLKAARALQSRFGIGSGAHITLVKHIPTGAGMGGGSADAAAVLVGLNQLWCVGASDTELQSIALTIGADVPFMLKGGLARIGGIGEKLMPLRPESGAALVVVQPCQPLSTREVFAAFDGLAGIKHPDTLRAQAALLMRDYAALSTTACNVLAQASQRARPQIGEAVAALQALGASFASMTGSGSAVYGAFASESAAQAAYGALKKRWRRCWQTATASEGVSIQSE